MALSFVRSPDDIHHLRDLINQYSPGDLVKIIAKIEKFEALEAIHDIIEVSDAIMIARGDLGIEIPAQEVPFQQKQIIHLCNDSAKPVITATQMLSSMVSAPRPTRAEASDVYNAIVDGTDAIMLSNETASGQYPIESVKTMTNIALIAEEHILSNLSSRKSATTNDSEEKTAQVRRMIGMAAYEVAHQLNPRIIVTSTISGYTTQHISSGRPHTPILCITPNEVTYRQMTLVWGVTPHLIEEVKLIEDMIDRIEEICRKNNYVDEGDILIIILGLPFKMSGYTNLLKLHIIQHESQRA